MANASSVIVIMLGEYMDSEMLRKVQLVQLEILKEVKRVCDKHNIHYFLTAGTLLGAVRHDGFIPWDDDLDIAMLADQYSLFCEIAPKELNPQFYFQNWDNDPTYPFEYGKVRKKNTLYVENKSDIKNKPGIYIDIIVYAGAPKRKQDRDRVYKKMLNYRRMLLCTCHYRPWMENDSMNLIKRVGYIYYEIMAKVLGRREIISRIKKLRATSNTDYLFPMIESKVYTTLMKSWYQESVYHTFEDDIFPIPCGYEHYLSAVYGDYMKLPPIEQRWNRHQIIEVKT